MKARIELAGGDEVAESAALWEWLCGERELAGAVRVVRRPVAEGELGGALEAILVAVASGGTGLALARSLTEWVKTRRPDITVTIKASGEMKLDARHVKSNTLMWISGIVWAAIYYLAPGEAPFAVLGNLNLLVGFVFVVLGLSLAVRRPSG